MCFRNGLIKLMVVALMAAVLIFAQPFTGQASENGGSSHSQNQSMSGSSDDTKMQGMSSETDSSMEKMPETNNETDKKQHSEDEGRHASGEESGHDAGDVNRPLLMTFAGINGTVILTAAALKRSKLKRKGVEI